MKRNQTDKQTRSILTKKQRILLLILNRITWGPSKNNVAQFSWFYEPPSTLVASHCLFLNHESFGPSKMKFMDDFLHLVLGLNVFWVWEKSARAKSTWVKSLMTKVKTPRAKDPVCRFLKIVEGLNFVSQLYCHMTFQRNKSGWSSLKTLKVDELETWK